MGIPSANAVEYYNNSAVHNFINSDNNGLSTTNLFFINMSTPRAFNGSRDPRNTLFSQPDRGDTYKMINIYATAINMPSRQMMSGQVMDIGVPTKYATGTGYGSVNITFQMPRNQFMRQFFEAWMNMIMADANNYVEDYNGYCCRRMRIYKMERGTVNGGVYRRAIENNAYPNSRLGVVFPDKGRRQKIQVNSVVSCMEIRKLWPQNIGTTQLNQRDARLNTITVGFTYERYRFFTNDNVSVRASNLDNVLDDESTKLD